MGAQRLRLLGISNHWGTGTLALLQNDVGTSMYVVVSYIHASQPIHSSPNNVLCKHRLALSEG